MYVYGLGTEIVECARIGKMIERHDEAFLRRAFTPREVARCSGSSLALHQYSAVWAAKQAVLKALHLRKTSRIAWCDLEIRSRKHGQMVVAFGGELQRECLEKKITAVHVTVATSRHYASATALAMSSVPGSEG
jgi:holo-[acyl-carrier protein] synthase